ncbi:MAG TPA: hypothetical protein VH437_12110 [Terriglobales bacterium]|jgi:hypothetical protein
MKHLAALLFLALSILFFAQATQVAQAALRLPENHPVTSDTVTHPCEADPAYHTLDFWVGSWDVYDNHDRSKGGTDVVEKVLDGCAIIENWHELSADGADGKSLFYYQRATKSWKQVWVTAVGPIKEKKLIQELKDGGVRFQGEIPHPDGKSHLDRTTLRPIDKDRVHQVIEISRDSGRTWEVTFDAEYRRQK